MIHVICLGNPLHADDGFGAAMANRLGRLDWPDSVRVIDASGRCTVAALFEGCRRALVVEALPAHLGRPGEILRLDGGDYPGHPPSRFSAGTDTMLAAVRRLVSPMPRIEVVGPVSICRRPFAPGLSPLVAAACQTLAARLAAELGGRRSGRSHRLSA